MERSAGFEGRHIGPSLSDEEQMLSLLGYSSMDSFISDVVPQNIAIATMLDQSLDSARSEVEVIAELR